MSEKGIWVYLEHDTNEFEDVSLEILAKASELAKKVNDEVTGIILASKDGKLAESAIKYGADKVILLKHQNLESYTTEAFTRALAELVSLRKPDIFLIGATHNGRDLAGRLAARLKTGLTANVVSLSIDEAGKLYSGVPGYGSKIVAEIVCVKNKPQMSTVRAGIFEKNQFDDARTGEIEVFEPDFSNFASRTRVVSRFVQESKDLSKSEKVVVAGNGVGNNLELVNRLAELLGADVGVTRPLADRGLISRDYQIGSTGVSLKARLAVVLGVSGAEHFVSGVEKCKTVIAVDIDKNSNVFNYSDYCVVGDALKILPEVIRNLEREK